MQHRLGLLCVYWPVRELFVGNFGPFTYMDRHKYGATSWYSARNNSVHGGSAVANKVWGTIHDFIAHLQVDVVPKVN